MRMFCASVLFFEAIIVALAIPVALTLSDVDGALVGWILGGLALACLICAGLLGRSWGVGLGSVLQVCVFLTGFVVPTMFVLGLMFGALWVAAVYYGRRVDAIKAARTP